MTLEEYRRQLGLSRAEFARRANIDGNTFSKAERGREITGRTARAIALALSSELGRTINFQEIDGLKIKV